MQDYLFTTEDIPINTKTMSTTPTKAGPACRPQTEAATDSDALTTKLSTTSPARRGAWTDEELARAKRTFVFNNAVYNDTKYEVHNDANAGSTMSVALHIDSAGKSAKRKRGSTTASAPLFLKDFRKTYESMKPENKWALPSGAYAEDILYKTYKDSPEQSYCHSWVINIADAAVKSCFDEKDWKAITATVPSLPKFDPALIKWVSSFDKLSPTALRYHLDHTPPISLTDPDPYGITFHARTWIYDVLRCWTRLRASTAVFAEDHREYWYIANIWSTLFDLCMTTLPGAYMSLGEFASVSTTAPVSTTARNNHPGCKRRRVTVHDDEIGAAEHSRKHDAAISSSEWARESLKVVKVLHGMLRELGPKAKKATVVGLVASGRKGQLTRMCHAGGYVCALAPDSVRSVPRPEMGVADLLVLCSVLWRVRMSMEMAEEEEGLEERLETGWAGEGEELIPWRVETDEL